MEWEQHRSPNIQGIICRSDLASPFVTITSNPGRIPGSVGRQIAQERRCRDPDHLGTNRPYARSSMRIPQDALTSAAVHGTEKRLENIARGTSVGKRVKRNVKTDSQCCESCLDSSR